MKTESAVSTRVRVRVAGKGETSAEFACEPFEPILHAGLRAGLDLPYECASGTCGTCKATLIEGEIACAWPEAPGHKTVKAERREFLMCQNRSLGDASISIAKRVEVAAPERPAPHALGGTIERIAILAPSVMSFDVALDAPIDFLAGQFVLFSVAGVEGARSYSMVNYSPACRTLSFLVKRFPGGALTTWLFETAKDGARVEIFGPLGRATFDPQLGGDVCLIAGGSGIAGMMAMLEHARRSAYFETHGGDVFFGVRTAADVFYLDELAAYARDASGKLRVTIALSDADATAELVERFPDLTFARGFVHDVARAACVNAPGTMFFIAGPPPMVDGALRMLLLDAKASSSSIRYDKFS